MRRELKEAREQQSATADENTRLLNELHQRTDDLSEALNLKPRTDYGNRDDRSTTAGIIGGFAGLGLIVAAMFVFSDANPRMAQGVVRPAGTASATTGTASTTTGSGAITGKGTTPANR